MYLTAIKKHNAIFVYESNVFFIYTYLIVVFYSNHDYEKK